MSRTEENKEIVDLMAEQAQGKKGEFENLLLFQLGVIATFLGDISKSLAVIADHYEMEEDDRKIQDEWSKIQAEWFDHFKEMEVQRREDDGK